MWARHRHAYAGPNSICAYVHTYQCERGWCRPHESIRGSKVADAGNQPLRPGSPEYHVYTLDAYVWIRIGPACAAWHVHMYVKGFTSSEVVDIMQRILGVLLSSLVTASGRIFCILECTFS